MSVRASSRIDRPVVDIECDATSFRPPNALEKKEGGEIVVAFDDNLKTVQLRSMQLSNGPERDGFTFDRVFPPGTQQHEVFDYGVKEYVHT